MIDTAFWDGAFARVVIAFFAIVDPLGNVLIFYLLTRALAPRRRILVAAIAVGSAGALLIVFTLAGQQVLDLLGISTPSFQVAAGLLLLLPAYGMVSRGEPIEPSQEADLDPFQVALVPLATPLLAGPGALATAISLAGTAGPGRTLIGLSAVLLLSFVLFAVADRLFALLGTALLRLITRLVGILLFALAVDFILKGLQAIFG